MRISYNQALPICGNPPPPKMFTQYVNWIWRWYAKKHGKKILDFLDYMGSAVKIRGQPKSNNILDYMGEAFKKGEIILSCAWDSIIVIVRLSDL